MEPLKILVVEDDAIYASFVAETLRGVGHEVHVAGDGITARSLASSSPDAVLIDLRLPDESGYDLARALRQQLPRTTTLILLTAERYPALDHAEAVGIDMVLTKPVAQQAVAEIVAFVRSARQRKLRLPTE